MLSSLHALRSDCDDASMNNTPSFPAMVTLPRTLRRPLNRQTWHRPLRSVTPPPPNRERGSGCRASLEPPFLLPASESHVGLTTVLPVQVHGELGRLHGCSGGRGVGQWGPLQGPGSFACHSLWAVDILQAMQGPGDGRGLSRDVHAVFGLVRISSHRSPPSSGNKPPKVRITEWKTLRKLQVSWTPSSLPFRLLVTKPALPTAGTPVKDPLAKSPQCPLSVSFCGVSPFPSQVPGSVLSISLNVRSLTGARAHPLISGSSHREPRSPGRAPAAWSHLIQEQEPGQHYLQRGHPRTERERSAPPGITSSPPHPAPGTTHRQFLLPPSSSRQRGQGLGDPAPRRTERLVLSSCSRPPARVPRLEASPWLSPRRDHGLGFGLRGLRAGPSPPAPSFRCLFRGGEGVCTAPRRSPDAAPPWRARRRQPGLPPSRALPRPAPECAGGQDLGSSSSCASRAIKN
uniref:Uncharacterized protein n=1 Tax=Rangifer tarandus platyrhynchus TaxID=3082113 RepID=A0ACB0EWW8_RANTA|nr:unnamed protein product [Rangifer tarandus platyrhynchus]